MVVKVVLEEEVELVVKIRTTLFSCRLPLAASFSFQSLFLVVNTETHL